MRGSWRLLLTSFWSGFAALDTFALDFAFGISRHRSTCAANSEHNSRVVQYNFAAFYAEVLYTEGVTNEKWGDVQ